MKSPWPFIVASALMFYATGAAFIESFVNYPSWRLVGPAEFVQYHQFITPRVVAFLVVPAFLASVATIVLLWHRPAVIPIWAIWVAIALQVIIWVSSAFIQIPIQAQLSSSGFTEEQLATLIVSNFWLRRVPGLLTAALFLWMLHRVIVSSQRVDRPDPNKVPEPTPGSP